jgi:hypothetical protein
MKLVQLKSLEDLILVNKGRNIIRTRPTDKQQISSNCCFLYELSTFFFITK